VILFKEDTRICQEIKKTNEKEGELDRTPAWRA
jgi:hypothetical protein